ncbi:MAG: hypothetical protein ACO1SV_12295 [Fimbriimonas sp.]
MAVSSDALRRFRRMVGEQNAGSTYTDEDLAPYIEERATQDERGETPFILNKSTIPPTRAPNPLWVATYDLHAAAADIWEEKAGALAGDFDFKTDAGEEFKRSQAFAQAQERARYHRARRAPSSISAAKWPRESTLDDTPWIGNLPEQDEE